MPDVLRGQFAVMVYVSSKIDALSVGKNRFCQVQFDGEKDISWCKSFCRLVENLHGRKLFWTTRFKLT